MSTLTLFLALVAATGLATPPAPQAVPTERSPASLAATYTGRAIKPGEVVRVDVVAPQPMTSVEAEAFGRIIPGVLSADRLSATLLVGLPVELAIGRHELVVRANLEGGRPARAPLALTVEKAVFPQRRMRTDPKFLEPPPEARERIARERVRIAEAMGRLSRDYGWEAPFVLPVDSAVTSVFGVRRLWNNQLHSRHLGVDLEGVVGTPVAAPAPGRVVLADDLYFTGLTVIIDHGHGVVSLLGHLSRLHAEPGQAVARGEVVGEVGATGRSTGPHLHWSARVGGASVDPLSLVHATRNHARP